MKKASLIETLQAGSDCFWVPCQPRVSCSGEAGGTQLVTVHCTPACRASVQRALACRAAWKASGTKRLRRAGSFPAFLLKFNAFEQLIKRQWSAKAFPDAVRHSRWSSDFQSPLQTPVFQDHQKKKKTEQNTELFVQPLVPALSWLNPPRDQLQHTRLFPCDSSGDAGLGFFPLFLNKHF